VETKRNQNQQNDDTITAVAMDTTVVVETPNIVGVAAGNAISQHLAAVAASLVEYIKQRRSFYRFAPNNAAA
jgi:hypothetical protein